MRLIIPLHASNGNIVGVLDIDSPLVSHFSDEDRAGLVKFHRRIRQETVGMPCGNHNVPAKSGIPPILSVTPATS